MLWFLVVVMALVVVLALLLVLAVFAVGSEIENDEQARIDAQVRRAERQLHDVARDGFAAMLAQARAKTGQ